MEKTKNYMDLLIHEGSINLSDFYAITLSPESIGLQGEKTVEKLEIYTESFDGRFTLNDTGFLIRETSLDGIKIRIVLT